MRSSTGRVVFVAGPEGIGKTALVRRFARLARRRHWLLSTAFADAAARGPDGNVAPLWSPLVRRVTMQNRVLRSLAASAVEWLDVIPVVGRVLHALVETVLAVVRHFVPRGPVVEVRSAPATVDALLEWGADRPRLIVVENLDRGGEEALGGAAELIRRLDQTRTLLVLTVRTRRRELDGAPAELLREAERNGLPTRLMLAPLAHADVTTVVERATGSRVPSVWLEWLEGESGGNPAHLWAALDLARSRGALVRRRRRWTWMAPAPELDMRLPRETHVAFPDAELPPADRRLLSLAAQAGMEFRSAALAEHTGRPELDVEDDLSRLARKGWIEFVREEEAGSDLTNVYRFRDRQEAVGLLRDWNPLELEQQLEETQSA